MKNDKLLKLHIMKILITLLFIAFPFNNFAQDVLNPYKDYSQSPHYPDWPLININSGFQYSHYSTHSNPGFIGEYEIDIGTIPNIWNSNFSVLAKSYKIEAVSFPFTMPCTFQNPGCNDGSSIRNLFMPDEPYNGITSTWGFLSREMLEPGIFDNPQTLYTPTHQDLATVAFSGLVSTPLPIGRYYFPHTILKHTITIHCGSDEKNNDPVTSISWYYDNTRGRMRYYPFINTNSNAGPIEYDIIYFPDFLGYSYNYGNTDDNYIENYSAINYFPYTSINNPSSCQLTGTSIPTSSSYFGSYVYPNDNLLISASARSWRWKFIAGFNYDNHTAPDDDIVTKMEGVKHDYFINKGYPDLDLTWINPNEKLIFNPSQVSIISQNATPTILRFPSLYTFKTILGVYPSMQEVNDANTIANGGPYSDPTKVPVPVNSYDLMPSGGNQNDYPEVAWDDPTTAIDERYGYYYIENLGQISVEPCVKIFDAKFEVKQGGTLLFEDYTQIKNPDRFTITGTGGAIAKNYLNIQLLQNTIMTQPQHITYIAQAEVHAGSNVDPNQPIAPFSLETGSDVEFLAGNAIYLTDGFSAKQGSAFYAACGTVSPPVCSSGWRISSSHIDNLNNGSTLNNEMSISPNPASNEVNIYCKNVSCGKILIIDIIGKVIKEQVFNYHSELNISDLPNGIYLAQINNYKNGSIMKCKFIVYK